MHAREQVLSKTFDDLGEGILVCRNMLCGGSQTEGYDVV